MAYHFATERPDYGDLAAGAVLYGLPGHPAFPIRLTSEIFQRSVHHQERDGRLGPFHVYDPCCGSGYLLVTLAFLHWPAIRAISASDIDEHVLDVAAKNLDLLTPEGMQRRIDQIEAFIRQYGKSSHTEALQSAYRLKTRVQHHLTCHSASARTFRANVLTDNLSSHFSTPVDLVITDIPYGNRSTWSALPPGTHDEATWHMLGSLLGILSSHSVVAIASSKQEKVRHEGYRRIDHFQIGKRRVVLLQPVGLTE